MLCSAPPLTPPRAFRHTQGELTKQSTWLKDWRRRHFVLKGSMLFFSKQRGSTPHGAIDLSKCMTVKSAAYKAGKAYALEVSTPDTTYFMFADSDKIKDDWIGAIGRAIVRCSATYTNEDGVEGDSDDESEYKN